MSRCLVIIADDADRALMPLVFLFQAEDGIRAPLVTGVQTCALPIWVDGVASVVRGAFAAGEQNTRRLLCAAPDRPTARTARRPPGAHAIRQARPSALG